MKASTCATRMKIVAALTSLAMVLLRTVSREAVTSLILRAHVMMRTTTASPLQIPIPLQIQTLATPLQIQTLAAPLQVWTSSVRAERDAYLCIFPHVYIEPLS